MKKVILTAITSGDLFKKGYRLEEFFIKDGNIITKDGHIAIENIGDNETVHLFNSLFKIEKNLNKKAL